LAEQLVLMALFRKRKSTHFWYEFRIKSSKEGIFYAIRPTKEVGSTGIVNGKLNSTIKLNGNLDQSMSPDLKH
jgi:hypothetical protein